MEGLRAIGADACRAGWVVAAADVDSHGRPGLVTISVAPDFATLLRQRADRVAVDMPIGLPDRRETGGRACDIEARAILGVARGASVFPAPPRGALALVDFDDPRRPDFGLSRQVWGIMPRIREVDAVITPELQDPGGEGPLVMEVHPELAFADLAGGEPIALTKHSEEGRLRRRMLLEPAFRRQIPVVIPVGASDDDVLDALACLWVACGPEASLSAVPGGPAPRDARGLAMQIWRRDAAIIQFPAMPGSGRRSRREALVDRLLEALGDSDAAVVRPPGGPRPGVPDLRLDTPDAAVLVVVEMAGADAGLAGLWPLLRSEAASGRRRTLAVSLLASGTRDRAARRHVEEFLVERMADDLGPRGFGPGGAGWDAIVADATGTAETDAIPSVVARVREALAEG